MTERSEEYGPRRRWRFWVGLVVAAVLAWLMVALYESEQEQPPLETQSAPPSLPPSAPSSAPSASVPIPPPTVNATTAPPAANNLAAPQNQAGANPPAWLAYAVPAPPAAGKPRIAVVIDDLGLDRARTERALKLKGPLTLAFLAYAGNLPQQAEAARKAGDEVLLHVATGGMNPAVGSGPDQTPAAPPPDETLRRLRWDLDRLPGYVGVDMPAAVTGDPQVAPLVMGEIKTRGLLFLDNSDDAASSVAARNSGVPYAARDELLDGTSAPADIDGQLARLEDVARKNGTAVAIGHADDRTLDALRRWLPTLARNGIVLVPLTDVVKTRNTAG